MAALFWSDKMATKLARVLVDVVINGVNLRCDDVIKADDSVVLANVKSGIVDDDKNAVNFALKQLGKTPVVVS